MIKRDAISYYSSLTILTNNKDYLMEIDKKNHSETNEIISFSLLISDFIDADDMFIDV